MKYLEALDREPTKPTKGEAEEAEKKFYPPEQPDKTDKREEEGAFVGFVGDPEGHKKSSHEEQEREEQVKFLIAEVTRCQHCGKIAWWVNGAGSWTCGACHPEGEGVQGDA